MNKTNTQLLKNTAQYRKTPKGLLTNSYNHQKNRKKTEYSLRELQDSFIKNKRFERLFKEWQKSGYKKEMKPTVDRIDCLKGYTLKNIQVLTWAENRYKQRMELKRIRARKCYMCLNGKVIKVFGSQREAVLKTGLSQGNLSEALNKKRRTCGGYNWTY